MNLQTEVKLDNQQKQISYDAQIVCLGSCFAENIGEKFQYYKFRTLINPFGILFHPKAIETFLWMSTQQEQFVEEDLFYHNEQWHCFDAHSRLSGTDKSVVLDNLNDALIETHTKLISASHIIITLGTSWVYRLKALDLIVANCHKVPQSEFEKELLSVQDIEQSLHNIQNFITHLNPKAQLIFTVSPIRHVKDGLVENNLSKSHLTTALHQFLRKNLERNCYFPAFEIMMDELRDYRFYKRDMLHPSALAVDYIWSKFREIWIEKSPTQETMKSVDDIQKGLLHKPFNPSSESHKKFQASLETKIDRLKTSFSFMNF